MTAQDILLDAAGIVSGPRQAQHGPQRQDFTKIADVWNAYIRIRRNPSCPLDGEDVATMMELLKIARSQCGQFNADDYLDKCGYAGISGELASAKDAFRNG